MCYKDEAEMARGPVSFWHGETSGTEFIPIIAPNMEVLLVLVESFDKIVSIFHNIFTLVPVNIHSILLFSVLPPKFGQPMVCCVD